MKNRLYFLIFSLFVSSLLYSQEKKSDINFSGKPFVKIFTNFHSSFTDDKIHNAFEIQRAYLGYAYKLNEKFSGKLTIDFGNPQNESNFMMTSFLKHAYIRYKAKKIDIRFGLIGRNQFSLQEKQWGRRYLFKSFQGAYNFGSSADLGIAAEYKLTDKINIDAAIENGEGYKKIEQDSVLKYCVGLTICPIKELKVRAYYDYMGEKKAQQTISFYTGYSKNKFKIAAEYNHQLNNKMKVDSSQSGYSLFASYKLNEKYRFFTRFDELKSVKIKNTKKSWNYDKEGEKIIIGLEFNPTKGVKISPNYQAWIYKNNQTTEHVVYISCEFKF